MHRPTAGTGDSYLVYKVLVQVLWVDTRFFLEFLARTYADGLSAVVAFPNWQRIAPEAVAAYRPVTGVFQPLAKASVANVRRYPFYLLVRGDHRLFDWLDFDKPARYGAVDERAVTTPAVGVRVDNLLALYKLAFFF